MRLQFKILLTVLPIVLVGIFGLGFWAYEQARAAAYDTAYDFLELLLDGYVGTAMVRRQGVLQENQLDDIPSFVRAYQENALEEAKVMMARVPGRQVLVFGPGSTLLLAWPEAPDEDALSAWHRALAALPQTDRSVQGFADIPGEPALYLARHFAPWNWTVLLTVSEPSVLARTQDIRRGTIIAASVFSLLTVIAIGALSHAFLTAPLTRLSDAAAGIARHEPLAKVPVHSNDELGHLARHMEAMAAEIWTSQQALQEAHEKLEERVVQRTRELSEEVVEHKRTRAELARSNSELEQFAYAVSHDLQEPLRMVASYVQLLARRYQGQLDSEADEFISYAVDGAQRMHGMISDLLEYSRVHTKGAAPAPTDAGAAVDGALRNLHAAIEDSKAQIDVGPMPQVMADASQLLRLFQNLIGNAVKYRAPDRPPRITVSAERLDGEWCFLVADNGIGISEKNLARVFGVFQRLHPRDHYGGTGIGLALAKRIVERHGGEIWVTSTPGEGSTFHFTLKAA